MDLSLLPTPASESKPRTGARFTVRSANSPSYVLTRRPGVRRPRGFSEEEGVGTKDAGGTNKTNTNKEEDHTATVYQGRSVKGQCEVKETSGHKSQNDSSDKTISAFGTGRSTNSNPSSESRGRTDWRVYNPPSRSKSLDWRTGKRSPDRSNTLSTRRGGDINKEARGLDGRWTGVEGMRGRVMSSVQAYNSAATSNDVQLRSPENPSSHTLDRASRGNSLPSRLRSQSGPGADSRSTVTSFGPKGGQTILERIEKLYGSAGKTEDFGKIRDLPTPLSPCHKETTPDVLTSPQQRSRERAAGGTFPRCFSSGEESSLSPAQSKTPFSWTQKDTSETSISPGTSRTREILSRGLWQGQTQSRYSNERGIQRSRGMEEIGTRSLDRARSRSTLAAQIRSARAAEVITAPPQSNAFLEEGRSSLRDSSELRERRASGNKDEVRGRHGVEKGETNGISRTVRETTEWVKEQNGAKESIESQSSSTDEDVFESNPQKITFEIKSQIPFERKKLPVTSAASVKNKINQFEALTQRSQGVATGQAPIPRRTFSVPTQLSKAHDGVKKSGSAKAIGGLRDKWEGLKDEAEAGEKTEEKATLSGRKLESGRSLSVDEVGLRSGQKECDGNTLFENQGKETDSGNNHAGDHDKYSRLSSTLEIPLNKGGQRQDRNLYIDEADFGKVSSPEEPCKRPSSLPLSCSSDASAGVQRASRVTLSVSDEDKTPTNTPNHSPLLSPSTQPGNTTPIAESGNESTSFPIRAAKTLERNSPSLPRPLASSPLSKIPELISPDVNAAFSNERTPVLDLDAWIAGLNTKIKVWNDDEDDDDESTQKDEDSNYDSDSGESSVTITSNMSQSDRRSFCVSLSDLCNFAGVDYESENDSDEWQSTGRRTASLSSDMSAMSCVSVLPSEELDRLLEDVRSLGDNNLQEYNDVQVVVLHKEIGVGLGFSVAGGVDQNKPITVHKVFHSGVAAQEGSIREGDQVLSINGTSLCRFVHWEALRVLRRAKTRELGVVVLRRGGISSACKGGAQTNNTGSTQTQPTETGQSLCVRLEKNSRDLGFSLEGGVGSSLENKPLTVQKIFQGGPVDKVCPGDEVLEIEGVSMVGMRRLEAWTLIRRLPPGPVDVVLCRPLKHL